jgi:hypothetical protein
MQGGIASKKRYCLTEAMYFNYFSIGKSDVFSYAGVFSMSNKKIGSLLCG